jgi:hypothetical protein
MCGGHDIATGDSRFVIAIFLEGQAVVPVREYLTPGIKAAVPCEFSEALY